MMRWALAASVGPPNIIVPRQISDTLMPLLPRTRYFICAMRRSLRAMLDHEPVDAAVLALLDERVAGGLAECREIGHRARIGRQHLELGPDGQLGQGLLGLEDGQRTGEALGVERLVGHARGLRSRWAEPISMKRMLWQ